MNIQLYFLRVRNACRQVYRFFERRWKRNALWTTVIIIFFVTGLGLGKAWASERPSGRVSDRKPDRVLAPKKTVPATTAAPTTTTTSSTTTVPVVRKSRSTETNPQVSLPSPEQVNYAPESIEAMIAQAFPENPQLWIAIARCESGLRSNAYNPSGASGIFQMMMPMHAKLVNGDPFDPATNIRAARSLSRNGTSTGPWDASRHCWS